jgi:AcrR family transcriptional regulator
MPESTKAPRADAQRNREALLAAASSAFSERGVGTSLEEIARQAGVGVGTLYRHFPQRDALISAVYERELGLVADVADELLELDSGMDALRAWTDRFVEYAIAKRGLGDALRSIMEASPELRCATLPKLEAAVEQLVTRGVEDGSIRADARADDLLRAMTAIFHIPHDEGWVEQARRILNLLLDGLAPRA